MSLSLIAPVSSQYYHVVKARKILCTKIYIVKSIRDECESVIESLAYFVVN